ncbi:DUF883 family protein [Paracoccus methylarcula]|uniref:DUF883 domain-containing protein n=1 Tax=Paracoccus methylarcula TaxID=72022 RepID=A0A3R7LLH1_9RHOB|nr:DUF883 family protein [Paracoccus methylarcula]RNF35854.1 DUF883 domain-containing protein [Paracoccus methylarcula]
MANRTTTAEDVKHDTRAAAREAREDLKEGARKLKEDARETLEDMADNQAAERLRERGAEFAETVRETGREYADRARAGAGRLYEEGHRKAEEGYDELSELVRRHPAKSLGIAAGLGFLVGLILARR